jgi:hypothetical protein
MTLAWIAIGWLDHQLLNRGLPHCDILSVVILGTAFPNEKIPGSLLPGILLESCAERERCRSIARDSAAERGCRSRPTCAAAPPSNNSGYSPSLHTQDDAYTEKNQTPGSFLPGVR